MSAGLEAVHVPTTWYADPDLDRRLTDRAARFREDAGGAGTPDEYRTALVSFYVDFLACRPAGVAPDEDDGLALVSGFVGAISAASGRDPHAERTAEEALQLVLHLEHVEHDAWIAAAARDAGLSTDAIAAAVAELTELVWVGRQIVPGLGRLEPRHYRAYTGRNPHTGEPVDVPAKVRVSLSPERDATNPSTDPIGLAVRTLRELARPHAAVVEWRGLGVFHASERAKGARRLRLIADVRSPSVATAPT